MRPGSISAKHVLAFVLVLGLAAIVPPRARAQTFSVVHTFTGGSDGASPLSGFTINAKGNLYGTTNAGGASGAGTVFMLTHYGTEVVLYSFAGGADGANPQASLIMDSAGNLYGTTNTGGTTSVGTVFEVTRKRIGNVLEVGIGEALAKGQRGCVEGSMGAAP